MCTVPESSVYPGTFLNLALSKVSESTLSLISLFKEINDEEYEEAALGEMIQYGNSKLLMTNKVV